MSLILEALKKSEQQRKLGEAPTLGSPVVSTRRRRSVLPVIAVLIVIAAGAGWWLTRKPAEPPAAPAPPPVTADATAPARSNGAQAAKRRPACRDESGSPQGRSRRQAQSRAQRGAGHREAESARPAECESGDNGGDGAQTRRSAAPRHAAAKGSRGRNAARRESRQDRCHRRCAEIRDAATPTACRALRRRNNRRNAARTSEGAAQLPRHRMPPRCRRSGNSRSRRARTFPRSI